MSSIQQREDDIKKLCKNILETPPDYWDNPNGKYESTCPFCHATEHGTGSGDLVWLSMSEIQHKAECTYSIAKNLLTK